MEKESQTWAVNWLKIVEFGNIRLFVANTMKPGRVELYACFASCFVRESYVICYQPAVKLCCSVFAICLMSTATILADTALFDTWTSADGRFTVDAEFVQLKDGKVQLKRNDNQKLIWVALTDLAEKDRAKAKQLADSQSSDPETTDDGKTSAVNLKKLRDQIKVSSELKFDDMIRMNADGEEEPKRLKVLVVAKGDPAATAFRYGKVSVDEFVDDQGEKLEVIKDDFTNDDISKDLLVIDRDDSFFSNHPKDGVAVELLVSGKDLPKTIKQLSGEFTIETGGDRSIVALKDLTKMFGKELMDEGLSKRGIKVELMKQSGNGDGDSQQLSFSVSGSLEKIVKVFVGDQNKKPLEQQNGSSTGGFGNQMSYGFYFDGEVPANATLYVEVVDNPVQLKVPFDFKNLKVPTAR